MAEEEGRNVSKGILDLAMDWVIPYITDPKDLNAASLVCRRWHKIDLSTRKHVTFPFCYSTTPSNLQRRFPKLESLKLKVKPRAATYGMIPEDWGGKVTPWIQDISQNLKHLHLRHMTVKDSDLKLLADKRGDNLESLKLDWCSGFSTRDLGFIARQCR